MNWSLKKYGKLCTVILPENIFEINNIEAFKDFLKDWKYNGIRIFHLNLENINTINAAKLALFINLYKFANFNDIEIKLYNISPAVNNLIYATGLNRVFDICDPNREMNENYFEFQRTNNEKQPEYVSA